MEKLTKNLYIKHAKRLEAIINEQSPFIRYLVKYDFQNILKNQLNMLFSLEKRFKDNKVDLKFTSAKLLDVLNKIAKTNFKIDEKVKFEDDADYIDNMNYLVTYCSNIYKVNLDDLISGKKVKVAQPDVKIRSQVDNSAQAGNAPIYGAEAMGMAGQFINPRQNPFIISQASAKLQSEIITGQFYRFKTKPKIIPIIKWIATILVMLTSLGLILMSIFAFMTNGIQADFGGEVGVASVSTITDGIFFLLFSGIGIYNSVMYFKTNLSKNPNDKYYFSWQIILIFLVGAIFAILFCINGIFELGFYYVYESSTSVQVVGAKAWHYIWFINLSLTIACIIPIIIGSIMNPKIDSFALEKRLGEIIDQLTTGFGPSKTSTSVDLQKPTEIQSKNDEKK